MHRAEVTESTTKAMRTQFLLDAIVDRDEVEVVRRLSGGFSNLEYLADTGLATALNQLRQARTQIAVVTDADTELGVITLSDVLPGLMPTAIIDAASAT